MKYDGKRSSKMSTGEFLEVPIKKSMAYDLLQLMEENPAKENYSVEEIKRLIKSYIITATA